MLAAFAENEPACCMWQAAHSFSRTACAWDIRPLEYTRWAPKRPRQPIQTTANKGSSRLSENFARFNGVGLLK